MLDKLFNLFDRIEGAIDDAMCRGFDRATTAFENAEDAIGNRVIEPVLNTMEKLDDATFCRSPKHDPQPLPVPAHDPQLVAMVSGACDDPRTRVPPIPHGRL